MAGASFTRDLSVPATPEQAWSVVTDVERLASWVELLEEVEELSPLASYRTVLADRLGPFKLRADLDVTLTDVIEGRQLRVHAEGEDRQVASRITIDALLTIEASGTGCTVGVDGNYDVAGRVATLGASVISKKADHLLDVFFTRTEEALS